MKTPSRMLRHPMNKWGHLFIWKIIFLLFFNSNVFSQTLSEREVWDGPYDIKMIGAPNLIPVFVNPTNASSGQLRADSVIRHWVIQRSGDLIHKNNQYKEGSPFSTVSLPMSAFLCGDPNVGGCYLGLTTADPDEDCSGTTYEDADMVSRIISMSYSDYDTDLTTYSSSMAQLDISSCSEIEAAYLYWAGMYKGSSSSNEALTLVDGPTNSFNNVGGNTVFNVSTTSGYNQVRFKIPGGSYQTITADATISPSGINKYVCIKDVTSLVQGTGGGQFWVANLQSYPNESGGGSSSGWTLVVVFRSPLSHPRRISLWDGLQQISTGGGTFEITGLQTPATSNFKSYAGFAALDAEDVGAEIKGAAPIGMEFKTNNGPTVQINPMLDQPPVRLYNEDGYPATCSGLNENIHDDCNSPLFDANWCSAYEGIASSHITTYNEVTNKNGNEIVRLPSNINTLGFDAHHMKLPNGSITSGATSAEMTLDIGGSGTFDVFLAYIAIERLQPKLVLTKVANKTSTPAGNTITYTLTVTNVGNTASTLNDKVFDTLDVATDYQAGSFSGSSGVTLSSSAGDNMEFNLPAIAVNGTATITFTVVTKGAADAVYSPPVCKRTITNTAWARYSTASAGQLKSKSNSNDCGIGEETRVLVTGVTAATAVPIGPITNCSFLNESVFTHVQANILSPGGVSASIINDFDIRYPAPGSARVQLTDVFAAVANQSFFAYRDNAGVTGCQQIYEVKYNCPPLPVELISFKGWKSGGANVLRWTTATEKNNDYFIVERSLDGTDFIQIGIVDGNGNSSSAHTYRFDDTNPGEGINYYRLKQVDENGSIAYSKTISVENRTAAIEIYPNPNEGSFTISVLSEGNLYRLDITDLEGRLVYTKSADSVPSSIDVSDLAKGMYIVNFYLDGEVIIEKLVVY